MNTEMSAVPLGPLAGATVEFWHTPKGTLWHGDPDCSMLRSAPISSSFVQPGHGDIDDREFPEKMHCQPTGRVGLYVTAAERLQDFIAETAKIASVAASDDGALSVLEPVWNPLEDLTASDDIGVLRPLWEDALARRQKLVSEVARRFYPGGSQMALASAAAWVRSGRKPREHDPQYAMFLRRATAIHEEHQLGANGDTRSLVNSRILPEWLEDVSAGIDPVVATERVIASEIQQASIFSTRHDDSLPKRITKTLTVVGEAWALALEAITVAHQSEALVIYDEYDLPSSLRELARTYLAISGGAELQSGDFHWVVTRAPSVLRLAFQESKRGVSGLVLVEQYAERFDSSRCAGLLRNFLTAAGHRRAGKSVQEVPPGALKIWERADSNVELKPADLPQWPRDGFSTLGVGRGITVADFAPFLRV